MSSRQLVRLLRVQGAPPTAQSADLRADVPTRDLRPAMGSAIALRRRRGAPLPHRAAEKKESAVRVTANRHQPNPDPLALEKKPRERGVCRFVGATNARLACHLVGVKLTGWTGGHCNVVNLPRARAGPLVQAQGPRGRPARRSVQCCAQRQGHEDTLLTESWGWERRWPCRSFFCFEGAVNGRPFAVANCNLGGASVDLHARSAPGEGDLDVSAFLRAGRRCPRGGSCAGGPRA